MKIYEFGKNNAKTLLMFQCAAEPTWVFEASARELGRVFHVFLAGADGHDPSENTTFTTLEDYAEKAVYALKKRGIERLDATYGISMGGAAVIYLLGHHLLQVKRAVIDAGITPYSYPKWICRLISYRDALLIPIGTLTPGIMKKIMPMNQWTQEGMDPEEYYRRIYDFEKNIIHAGQTTMYSGLAITMRCRILCRLLKRRSSIGMEVKSLKTEKKTFSI